MALSFEESKKQLSQLAAKPMVMSLSADDDLIAAYSDESWERDTSGRYRWFTNSKGEEIKDDKISYVDDNKNITVDNSQVNISQETNSQFIPFEMARCYDNIDLKDMGLSVHFTTSDGNHGASIPVNVQYTTDKIKFFWLVDDQATRVPGTIQFEIHADGAIYDSNNNKYGYRWKSKSTDKFNIIKSLCHDNCDEIIKVDDSWVQEIVDNVASSVVDRIADIQLGSEVDAAKQASQDAINAASAAQEAASAASDAASQANQSAIDASSAASQAAKDAVEIAGEELKADIESTIQSMIDSANHATITYVDDEINKVKGEIPTVPTNISEFTNDAGYATTDALQGVAANIPTKLSELENDASLTTETYVQDYVTAKMSEIDVKDQLGDYAKTEDIPTIVNELDLSEHQSIKDLATKQDVTDAIAAADLDNYYKKEETYSQDEVDELLKNIDVDVDVDLSNYYTKTEVEGKINEKLDGVELDDYATIDALNTVSASVETVRSNTVTNATNISTVQNDIASIKSALNALEGDNKNLIIQYDEVGSILHLYEKDEDGDITITDGDEQIKVKEISSTIITGAGGGGSALVSTIKLRLSPDGEDSSTVLYGNPTALNYNLSTRKAKESQDEDGNDVTIYEEAVIAGDITLTLYRNNVYLTHFTVTKTSSEVQSGSVDISDYIALGNQVFTITASYVEQLGSDGETITVRSSSDWAINAVNLKIADLPDSEWEATPKYSGTTLSYTPIGDLEKTIYFKIDEQEPDTFVTPLNGTTLTYTIPHQSHGVHTLQVWCEGNVGGSVISTDVYKYVLMFVEDGNNTPIIRIKAPKTLEQYSSAYIYYNVFDPLNGIIDSVIGYDEDGITLFSVENITSAERKWEFKPSIVKDKTITIQYKEMTESVTIEVTKFPYEINAVTGNLMVDFVPTGRTNSDVDYNVFKNNAYTIEKDSDTGAEIQKEIPMTWTLSDNFDWINGGWKTDENGDTYFCVKSGTSVDINYNLFGTDGVVAKKDANGDYNIAGTGKEFKLVFKTTNVAQANATWLECIDVADKKSLGIRMESQNAYIDSGLGTLEIPYADDDIIEFDMNIVPMTKFLENGEPNLNVKAIPMIITYEDGTPVQPKVISSPATSFKQDAPKPITIGSKYCDVHIYRMKVYERYLEDKEILTNFIADARSGTEMAKRYVRNDIYPIENKQKITPESVAAACPDLKVYVLSAPHFTNDKGDKVTNTTIKQIHNTGTKEKPEYDDSENWIATGATHNGQGTSSNEYGYSGRNLEFNMKKATITLNDNKTVVKEIQLSPTSYPTNYLNFKINIASSENANNALLQKRYDRYLPYTSVASLIDDRKKNSMEFFNCVVFIQETDEDISTHREFGDTDIHFYGIGNIGDSKKTDDTRVNDKNDANEFCVEIMDWNRYLSSFPADTMIDAMGYTTDKDTKEKIYTWAKDENLGILYELIDGKYVLTKDATVDLTKTYYVDILEHDDFSEDYTYGFRYLQKEWKKDDDPNYKVLNEEFQRPLRQKWIEFYRFVTRDLTTNGVEDSKKVEAWKSEFSNWFVLDAALYYYLYTLRYTMVDNRAKNTFWHWGKHYLTFEEANDRGIALYDSEKNLITDASNLPSNFYDVNGNEIKNINAAAAAINNGYRMDFWDYDNDTALGIDNAGKLEIPIGVEEDDVDFDGVPYFRAHDSLVFARIARYFVDELEDAWHNTEINPIGKVFNSTSFINEFDSWQNEFPEELWRLDYERKYKRTYVGGTGKDWDNALPQSNSSDIVSTRFLTEMMNGRKKYQRRCFERNQEIYMSSKFKGEVNLNDTITLRGTGRPTGKVVQPDFTLNITPFSKMYVNLYSATDKIYYHQKCEAGVPCDPIPYPETTLDFIYIRGASQIQSLGDLSPMYLQTAELPAGAKLKTVTLGNATDGYENNSLKTLQIGAGNKLLEELDIRNLSNFNDTKLPVSNIPSLKRVYAQGSNMSEAVFANNGLLEEAYLPATITRLELRNLHYLKTISLESYDNLLHLVALNCSDMMNNLVLDMVNKAPDLTTLRATNINWELSDTAALEKLYSLIKTLDAPEVVLTGKVHVAMIREQQLYDYRNVWPDLEITFNTMIDQFPVTFINDDGTILEVQYVDKGEDATDPVSTGRIPTPTKESSISTDYTYAGWDTSLEAIFSERTIKAVYTGTTRTYTVKYVSKGITLQESSGLYGEYIEYNGAIPTYTLEETGYKYYLFKDWDKSGYIDGNKTINAIFDEFTYVQSGQGDSKTDSYTGKELKDLSNVEIYALSKLGVDNTQMVIEDGDPYSIRVGYDIAYNDIESKLIIEDKTSFDGTNYLDTGVDLFRKDRDFVLALDYEYLSGNTTNSVLAQCFRSNGSSGFKLWFNNGSTLKLQWGDKLSPTSPSSQGYREMLILRHKSGDDTIYVYKSNLNSDAVLTETITTTKDTMMDSTLVLGCAKEDDGEYSSHSIVDIHWCKVWYKDLGDSICKKLANWTHEKIGFEMCGQKRFYLTEDSNKRSMFSLLATHLLERSRKWNLTSTNTGGWAESYLNKFLNSRLYNAMPAQTKLLLKKVTVQSSIGDGSNDISKSECYITIPAAIELSSSSTFTAVPYVNEMAISSGKTISYMTSNAMRKRAYVDGAYSYYWTRSPSMYSSYTNRVCYVDSYGDVYYYSSGYASNNNGVLIEISF